MSVVVVRCPPLRAAGVNGVFLQLEARRKNKKLVKTDDEPLLYFNFNYRASPSSCRSRRAVWCTGNSPSERTRCGFIFHLNRWHAGNWSLLWAFQVHDHEGVLARRALTEADLQTAGRRSRPGSIDDLHRCKSPSTAAAHSQQPNTKHITFRFTLDRRNSSLYEARSPDEKGCLWKKSYWCYVKHISGVNSFRWVSDSSVDQIASPFYANALLAATTGKLTMWVFGGFLFIF